MKDKPGTILLYLEYLSHEILSANVNLIITMYKFIRRCYSQVLSR